MRGNFSFGGDADTDMNGWGDGWGNNYGRRGWGPGSWGPGWW
jgi:hypothetical protein